MTNSKSKTACAGGFTLLEILISVGILSTALVVFVTAQGSAFLASERGELLNQAVFLAREKMTEAEIKIEEDLAKSKFPDDSEADGTFDEPFDDFRWKQTIKKVEIPVLGGGEEGENAMVATYAKNVMDEISKSVRELKVTVFWGEKDKPEEDQPQLTLTTHVVKLK